MKSVGKGMSYLGDTIEVMKSLIPITINKIRGYKNPLIDTRAKVLDINRR